MLRPNVRLFLEWDDRWAVKMTITWLVVLHEICYADTSHFGTFHFDTCHFGTFHFDLEPGWRQRVGWVSLCVANGSLGASIVLFMLFVIYLCLADEMHSSPSRPPSPWPRPRPSPSDSGAPPLWSCSSARKADWLVLLNEKFQDLPLKNCAWKVFFSFPDVFLGTCHYF